MIHITTDVSFPKIFNFCKINVWKNNGYRVKHDLQVNKFNKIRNKKNKYMDGFFSFVSFNLKKQFAFLLTIRLADIFLHRVTEKQGINHRQRDLKDAL